MFFTQDDYRKIQEWLQRNSVKDTEFQEADIPLNGNEVITLVQNGHNKKVHLEDLVKQMFSIGIADFVNVSSLHDKYNITLNEAIQLVPHKSRKKGQVITFCNTDNVWKIYQFTGVKNQWNILDLWNDLFDWTTILDVNFGPDEEDITANKNEDNIKLSFKDRVYEPASHSGLGYKILRKNIVTYNDPVQGELTKNILVQDKVAQSNTIYEIRYDFDLNNQTINIPENSVLQYKGGSLNNGKIVYNNTTIEGIERLNNVITEGDYTYPYTGDETNPDEQLAPTLAQVRKLSTEVTNIADDEDLTKIYDSEKGQEVLQLKDRQYVQGTNSGMGYIILRQNKSFKEQVTKANTIYEIRYDFDLGGEEVEIPENCVLKFDGGKVENGTIVFDKTYLGDAVSIEKCILKGDILNEAFYVDWFGAKVNSNQDSTDAFKVISDYAYQRFVDNGNNVAYSTRKLILRPGTYCVRNIDLQGGIDVIGAGNYGTIIKSICETDRAVVTITHNDTIIQDLTIDGGSKEGFQNIGLYMYGNNGQNSIINNVRFINCYKKSAVIEDTNHVIIHHCAFNGGHEGYLLLDGADNIKVLYCNFETYEDFEAPYALKLQTKTTINRTANNSIISGCWFESNFTNTFKTSIHVDCMNVTIENNHFHAAQSHVKDYVCYIDNDADNIKFIYNNIQGTGTSESGENEKVLGVSENAQVVYAAYNRGLHSAQNAEINNTKSHVIYMDGTELLPDNYCISLNEVPFYIKTTSINNNMFNGALRYNNAWIWYDLNKILKVKYDSAPNSLSDGEPIGNYVAAGYSDTYPIATQLQIGRCYFDRSSNTLTVWNGSSWVRASNGVRKEIPISGVPSQKPNNADVPIGYMYYDTGNKRYVINDGTKWRLPNGYINNTANYSSDRPTTELSNIDIGFMFFDRSLSKPIWWTGDKWVDATGADV